MIWSFDKDKNAYTPHGGPDIRLAPRLQFTEVAVPYLFKRSIFNSQTFWQHPLADSAISRHAPHVSRRVVHQRARTPAMLNDVDIARVGAFSFRCG